MRHCRIGLIAILGGAGLILAQGTGSAQAQAVAFSPVIGTAPDGVAMGVTPAVSADRRYVRLSVGANFTAVDGFQNINIPLGAVAGGPGPGGGAGGGAIAGGGIGGFRSFGVPIGMDGPIGMNSGLMPANAMMPGAAGYDESFAMMNDASWSPAPRRSKTSRSRAPRSKPAAKAAPKSASPASASSAARPPK